MASKMIGRRGFLQALAVAPFTPTATSETVFPKVPDDYQIDFDLMKPCDMYFDEENKNSDGFALTIYDQTRQRDYEGYIRWWAAPYNPSDLAGSIREKAYATGYAQVVAGYVEVKFDPNRRPRR